MAFSAFYYFDRCHIRRRRQRRLRRRRRQCRRRRFARIKENKLWDFQSLTRRIFLAQKK